MVTGANTTPVRIYYCLQLQICYRLMFILIILIIVVTATAAVVINLFYVYLRMLPTAKIIHQMPG